MFPLLASEEPKSIFEIIVHHLECIFGCTRNSLTNFCLELVSSLRKLAKKSGHSRNPRERSPTGQIWGQCRALNRSTPSNPTAWAHIVQVLPNRKRIVQRSPISLKNHVRRVLSQLEEQIIPKHPSVPASSSSAVVIKVTSYYLTVRYSTPDHERLGALW